MAVLGLFSVLFGTSNMYVVYKFKHILSTQHVHCASRVPFVLSQDDAVCLWPTETRHRRRKGKHVIAGLTRSERMVHWAGSSSFPSEQRPAQAHIVCRVSDAELGQQQLPARPLHLRLSVLQRPSADRGRSGNTRKVTYG